MGHNNQPSEMVDWREGTLEVVDIYPTIQCEGPLTGTPAVFVRLAGCNLQCPWCDTNYTTNRQWVEVPRLVETVERLAGDNRIKLVVLTGGEPLRQDITQLVKALLTEGYDVQIETNGTLPISAEIGGLVSVVCSPKTNKIHPRLAPYVNALKYVIGRNTRLDNDGLPFAKGRLDLPREQIYIQPLDDGEGNNRYAATHCIEYGFRLSVQIHKLIGLP